MIADIDLADKESKLGLFKSIFSPKRLKDDFSKEANAKEKEICKLFIKGGFRGFTPGEVRYFCSWVLANPNPSEADIAVWIGHQYQKSVRSRQVQKLAEKLKDVI